MNIALAQISSKLSANNFTKHIDYINQAISNNYKAIVFPELSLNGYALQDAVREDYFTLDLFDVFCKLSQDIDIVCGAIIKENKKFFNTALFFSEGVLLHKHYKNILPNYGMFEESRFFDAGKDIKSFKSKFGNTGLCICEDLWDQNFIKRVKDLNLDFLIVLAASPARGFRDKSLEIQDQWYLILKDCSIDDTKVVFINKIGFEDGLGFWGGSCIIQNKTILNQAPLFKEGLY